MQQAIRRVAFIVSGLVICAATLLDGHVVRAAGTATMYLSPASGSIIKGNTLAIKIYENSGSDHVNAVQANLSYPTSLLSYTGYSSSSAFSTVAENPSGNTGSLHFARGIVPPSPPNPGAGVTGAQIVVTVRFKAVKSSGTAKINFTSGSAVIRSSDNGSEILSTTGGSYNLTALSSAPASSSAAPSSSSSSSKSSSLPSSSGSSSTSGKKTALTISGVSVSNLTFNTAAINWKTSAPASSEVDYGLNTRYGLSAASEVLTTSHTLSLNPQFLVPGTEYHFIVKSVDASSNEASSQDATFRTKGILLTVTVINQNKKVVKGAVVSLDNMSGTTNKNGQTVFSNLPAGKQAVSVLFNGKTTKTKVTIVSASSTKSSQAVTIKINTGNQLLWLWIALAGVAIIALAIVGKILLRRWKQNRELQRHFPQVPDTGDQGDNASNSTVTTITPEKQQPAASGTENQPSTKPINPVINPGNKTNGGQE